MNISLDVGNGNIKGMSGDVKLIMPSTLVEGVSKLDDTTVNIEFEGKHYNMGKVSGDRKRDYAKYNTDYHKVMTLASISLMIEKIENENNSKDKNKNDIHTINLIAGLPIGYYLNHNVEYRDILLDYTKEKPAEITVNGVTRKIKIEKCIVIPQSAVPFGYDVEGTTLVIDIGSGTVDVSYWDERSLIKAESYNIGCLDLYADIAANINKQNTKHNMEPFLIEKNLIKNPKLETIKIMGGAVNIKDSVNTAIHTFTESIVSKVSLDFSNYTLIDNLYVVGGGALFIDDEIKKTYEFAEVVKNVYFNAEIYDRIGDEQFGSN
ncbi:ParM/StbA family protein [Clostridium tertium]|uniref:ParM/StbA family protein n=1 Tax=Clostridium tertium TaxID=1559 RepID=UPI0023B32694|nr:ParM/StbA family protein [Clostridium tertium]